ncbi:MAG: DUF2291 domain-containing protein [Lachnospiraceae bacterium]|nr:DUF2291 domain-containing protein [Lachnospiraceae bacterium]
MKKKMIVFSLAIVLAMTTLTGCIKVVKIGEEASLTGEKKFSAGDDVAGFWDSQALPELTEKAIDLGTLLTEAKGDLKSLADKYGKYSMGTSGELSFIVKGSGAVMTVDTEKKAGTLAIKLDGYTGSEEVKIQVGSVIKGSSVRDSLSFIKFGDYTNQEDYAAVSQSINAIIMKTIINPEQAKGLNGKNVSFVGCFTVDSSGTILITPVELSEK